MSGSQELRADVARLLKQISAGDKSSVDQLVPLVYEDLRKLADHHIRNERVGHTLQPTALVHEAYLRVVNLREVDWRDRAHFISVASNLMRRILIDHARGRMAVKRDAGRRVDLDLAREAGSLSLEQSVELLALDEALERLAELDERQSRIVEMRYFGGLSLEEIGLALGLSSRTIKRDWALAKIFLHGEMAKAAKA